MERKDYCTFSINNVNDSLHLFLEICLNIKRKETVRKRSEYDFRTAPEREHIF